jgi:hypothetical protein
MTARRRLPTSAAMRKDAAQFALPDPITPKDALAPSEQEQTRRTARKITAKERATSAPADPIARENGIKATQDTTRKAERLHLDATGATVLTPKVRKVTRAGAPVTVLGGTLPKAIAEAVKKAVPVKHSALRDDKLSLSVVVVTKAQRVRDAFAAGMSLTESAKATGADPAYVWDLAKIWEEKTGTRVPRSGHTPKVVATATEKAKDAS